MEWSGRASGQRGQGAKKGNIGMLFVLDVPDGKQEARWKEKRRDTTVRV